MVARAAVQGAFTEPLRESVRNAATRADADAERKRKGKEKGIEQTTWGKDVTCDRSMHYLSSKQRRRRR